MFIVNGTKKILTTKDTKVCTKDTKVGKFKFYSLVLLCAILGELRG